MFARRRDSCTHIALILNNEELFAEWKRDIKTMAGRIIEMRKELHRLLTEELKTPGNWDHIVNHIGMFRYVAWLSSVSPSGSECEAHGAGHQARAALRDGPGGSAGGSVRGREVLRLPRPEA